MRNKIQVRNRSNLNPLPFVNPGYEGGAKASILNRTLNLNQTAKDNDIPTIVAQLYAPTPIVNTDLSRNEGIGMVRMLYNKIAEPPVDVESKPRTWNDKFTNWVMKGKFV